MGACLTTSEDLAKAQNSNNIDKQLAVEQNNYSKVIKVLLLGSGESGKSTIVKQMKIIHLDGYSKEELISFKYEIFRNVLESAKQILVAMDKIGAEVTDEQAKQSMNTISEYKMELQNRELAKELMESVKFLWEESGVKDAFDKISRFAYFIESAPYFFDSIDRIADPNYIPTTLDVLKARIKTTGISEIRFKMGASDVHMFDVGGQRSERKKWIHCFENVTSVMFVASLSEYDLFLLEDNSMNRLVESLNLFNQIVNSKWFSQSSTILFLNKTDIFEEKIKHTPLKEFVPDYEGPNEFEPAAGFIRDKFLELNKGKVPVYPYYTCATDTKQIEYVFAVVRETILSKALKETGII